jgi:hypothetical protein
VEPPGTIPAVEEEVVEALAQLLLPKVRCCYPLRACNTCTNLAGIVVPSVSR